MKKSAIAFGSTIFAFLMVAGIASPAEAGKCRVSDRHAVMLGC